MKKELLTIVLFVLAIVISGQIFADDNKQGHVFLDKTTQKYRLTGQWRFSRVDNPEFARLDIDDSAWEWITVPGNWNVLGIDNTEVAWYRFRFKLSEAFQVVPISIRVPAIMDAHELYVNGTKIGGAGIIEADGTITKKSSLPGVYLIPENLLAKKDWNVIALRVGDNIGWGGVETADFFIGRSELLDLDFKKFVVWNSAIFMILTILGLYFLGLYLGHNREMGYLFFSLLAFCISSILFGYYSFPYWLIDNFWFYHFVLNIGLQIAIVIAFYFFYYFYDYPLDRLTKLVTVIGSLFLLILLLTPLQHGIIKFYANVSLKLALIFDALGIVYLFYLVVKSIILGKPGAKTVGVGSLVILTCFLNDILGYLFSLDITRFANEGTVFFMVSISIAMFFKYSRVKYEIKRSVDPIPTQVISH